jgi:hypothetical protein
MEYVPMDDPVNPKHYQFDINGFKVEAFDYIRVVLGDEGALAYCRGSALKYLSRAGRKEGQPSEQDYKKAAWFCVKAAHIAEDIAAADDDIDWDNI